MGSYEHMFAYAPDGIRRPPSPPNRATPGEPTARFSPSALPTPGAAQPCALGTDPPAAGSPAGTAPLADAGVVAPPGDAADPSEEGDPPGDAADPSGAGVSPAPEGGSGFDWA